MTQDLLNIVEASRFLGLKPNYIIDLVKEKRLRAWRVWGEPVDLIALDYSTTGLRFSPEDLEAFLESVVVS
jgi:hypothetical protein